MCTNQRWSRRRNRPTNTLLECTSGCLFSQPSSCVCILLSSSIYIYTVHSAGRGGEKGGWVSDEPGPGRPPGYYMYCCIYACLFIFMVTRPKGFLPPVPFHRRPSFARHVHRRRYIFASELNKFRFPPAEIVRKKKQFSPEFELTSYKHVYVGVSRVHIDRYRGTYIHRTTRGDRCQRSSRKN